MAITTKPLVLLTGMGNSVDFLSSIKGQLRSKDIDGIVTVFNSLAEFQAHLEKILGKYPSIQVAVLRLRDIENPGELIKIVKNRGLKIAGISPEGKRERLVTFKSLGISGCSESMNCGKRVTIRVQHLLGLTTEADEEEPDDEATASSPSTPDGEYGDGALNNVDEDANDFSITRRNRPRKTELAAIESGVVIPKGLSAATAKRGSPPKKNSIVNPANIAPASYNPLQPKLPATVFEPTILPSATQLKPVRPSKATQPKGKAMKKNHAPSNDDITTLIRQRDEYTRRLLARKMVIEKELAAINEALSEEHETTTVVSGKTGTKKVRRKYSKKATAAKTSRCGKGKKKASGSAHDPGQKKNGELRKGQAAIEIEGKEIVLPKKTALVLAEFLAKPNTVIPDSDLKNGESEDMVVQRLVGVRKALDQRFGARRGRKALVTHVGVGHSLDLRLAH